MSKLEAYDTLALKFRPRNLDEMVGQDIAVSIVKGMVKTKKITRAFLISGPYGSGKTTLARLITKYVNCENFDFETLKPCEKCSSCKSFKPSGIEGNRDVHETNCALQTGVDDVRSINAQSKFNPTKGKFRVYILDEVHMLTNNAQQGLLKPLEEPSGRTIFLLCTTHPEKLHDTIISRCKKLTIYPLKTEHIVKLLKRICKKEKRKLDKKILRKIAYMTGNHARDALVALEAIFDMLDSGKKIKSDIELGSIVQQATGIPPWQLIQGFLLNLYRGSLVGTFKIMEKVENVEYFIKELLRYHQNGMYFSMIADEEDDLIDVAYRSFDKSFQKLVDEDKIILTEQFKLVMAETMEALVKTASEIKDYLVDGNYLLTALVARMAPKFKSCNKKDK